MSTYRFSEGSAVREIGFCRAVPGKPPVALLTASDRIDAGRLAEIRAAIEEKGWEAIPAAAGGKDILQVSGFPEEDALNVFLADRRFAVGKVEIIADEKEITESAKQSDVKKFFRHHSLQLGGILNLIGDAGLLMGGLKSRDKYKIAGGGLYTLGGLNLTLFGKVKPNENLRQITEGTAEIIGNLAGHVPEDSKLAEITGQSQGGLARAGNTLYRKAAQNTMLAYTGGAAAMLGSGIAQHRADPKLTAGIYYGVSSLIFKLASMLIPEKSKKDPNANNGVVNWIREKPMRLFGYGSLVTDTFLGWDAWQEYKYNPKKSDYRWMALTTVTYLLADFMMANSNKDRANAGGKLTADEQRRIEALAAEAIAREPREMQPGLIHQVAEFLAARPEINGKVDELNKAITDQMEHLAKNPWVSRIASAEHLQPGR